MAERARIAKTHRRYTLRSRADAMDRTRTRITRAAIELHGTVGPAATTMTSVAERAGVTRATLYRHFPSEEALFSACSGEWLRANPRPDVTRWADMGVPLERVAHAVGEMYRYYRSAEAMLANLFRDLGSLPDPIAAGISAFPDEMLGVLDQGWSEASPPRLRRAAIAHAVAFGTWRSLASRGLTDDEAASLMTSLVDEAAGRSG
jgi:AcrR family transcriptional regulator